MVDERAAIAILGPEAFGDNDVLAGAPAIVGAELARAGYIVVVSGSGDVATSATRAALEQRDGRVIAAIDPGGTPAKHDRLTVLEQPSLFRRIEAILEVADALIVLPGDLAALAALLSVWAHGHTRSGPYRPLLLLGDAWPAIVKSVADAAGLDRRTRAMVTFAAHPAEAVETLRYYVSPGG